MAPIQPRTLALTFLFLSLLVPHAGAQLLVELKMKKSIHVMGEDIMGEVTVHNRAGRDVILDGPGDQAWLTINVTNPAGLVVSKVLKKDEEDSIILRVGQAMKREINVTDYVNFDDFGNHGVVASVYFPEKRNFFPSPRARVDITDGQVFWEQVVGVPQGQIGAGSYRKYQLLTYNGQQRTELYVRIRDDTGHFEFGTFTLGTVILYRSPQATIDGESRLNLLFMAAPRTYRHIIIGTDGQIVSQSIYKEEGANRPSMFLTQAGNVVIRGGFYEDPTQNTPAPGTTKGKGMVRKISDLKIPGQ